MAASWLMWARASALLPLGIGNLPIAFLVAVIVGIPVHRKRRQRMLLGHCRSCGYNLTGNVSGVCSECGEPVQGDVSLDEQD